MDLFHGLPYILYKIKYSNIHEHAICYDCAISVYIKMERSIADGLCKEILGLHADQWQVPIGTVEHLFLLHDHCV